jgi:hypothetical protein
MLGLEARLKAEWQRLDADNDAQMRAYATSQKLSLVDEEEWRGKTLAEYRKMLKEEMAAIQQMIIEEHSKAVQTTLENMANESAATRQAFSEENKKSAHMIDERVASESVATRRAINEGMQALEEKLVDKEPKPKSLPARNALRAAIRKHGYPGRGGPRWIEVIKTTDGWSVDTTPMSLSRAKRLASELFPEGARRRSTKMDQNGSR